MRGVLTRALHRGPDRRAQCLRRLVRQDRTVGVLRPFDVALKQSARRYHPASCNKPELYDGDSPHPLRHLELEVQRPDAYRENTNPQPERHDGAGDKPRDPRARHR